MTPSAPVTLVYFAWVREKIGRAREDIALPASVATIADLIAFLRARGPEYESAFAKPDVIRAAINQTHVKAGASVAGAREIAVPPNRISGIVDGKHSITADTALRLGKYFGVSPELWLNLQVDYDLRVAKRTTWLKAEHRVRVGPRIGR